MARAVPAVERAFDVLELFLDEHELSAPEITAKLGLPRTTVHELVGTLAERGYLTPAGGGSNRFRLGVRGFQLGSAYAERLDLAREGRVVAETVAERCSETVHIGVLDGTDVFYVAKVDSSHPVRMVSAVGKRLPAHCTAVGKVLLAALPRQRLDELYASVRLTAMTDNSITNRRALRRELDTIAADGGVAREYCESNDAVACVAAPVRDQSGEVVAALSISAPILRWNEETEPALRELACEGARLLSERLGHRPAG
ncbi:IclR family transcriptional regulator [Saccharopolyspora erythraea NRRL 2338]|uniref:IclR-family transcriptional regulator n=2 Tax=Saccharopolyspora erythraea TaxID=1836 RepID=A4FFI3_SACEN|nr:IclR family transcriptional regulator [Saccharopolyspora erythraea]PFG96529.1 IclR family transcriptional regulator [Saccharopolyspora erythraea NRRL 2338]QRK93019.1 IclR family transcriptional regulator [Saccharopolyspora erythraea]CAM02808.1 IclR-family transcriptional regulator [Saccharopolyspora erythraea NRRL 2338]